MKDQLWTLSGTFLYLPQKDCLTYFSRPHSVLFTSNTNGIVFPLFHHFVIFVISVWTSISKVTETQKLVCKWKWAVFLFLESNFYTFQPSFTVYFLDYLLFSNILWPLHCMRWMDGWLWWWYFWNAVTMTIFWGLFLTINAEWLCLCITALEVKVSHVTTNLAELIENRVMGSHQLLMWEVLIS